MHTHTILGNYESYQYLGSYYDSLILTSQEEFVRVAERFVKREARKGCMTVVAGWYSEERMAKELKFAPFLASRFMSHDPCMNIISLTK